MWEELPIGDKTFRIRKYRSILADSIIEQAMFDKRGVGLNATVIKADCEIFDIKTKQWVKITDAELDNMSSREYGDVLFKRINELRKEELDFQKAQQKKLKNGSGS